MPMVIFSERDFRKDIMSGVISPRGMVRVPSTSKRAMMRGFTGGLDDIFCFLLMWLQDSSVSVVMTD